MSGTFAATPPTESLAQLLIDFATKRKTAGTGCVTCSLSSACKCEIYIEVPEDDSEPGMIGKLSTTMYGTRDAVIFTVSLFRESDGCRVWVHGDDKILEVKASRVLEVEK